jgi:hypothetical protein
MSAADPADRATSTVPARPDTEGHDRELGDYPGSVVRVTSGGISEDVVEDTNPYRWIRNFRGDSCCSKLQEWGLDKVQWHDGDFVHLLYDNFKNPRVAEVIKKVECAPADVWIEQDRERGEYRDDWLADFHGTVEAKEKFDDMAEIFVFPALNCLELTDEGFDRWEAAVREGNHHAICTILLLKIPNVNCLTLMGYGFSYKPFLDPIFRYTSSKMTLIVLSKLNKVYVQHWHTEFGEDPAVIDEIILVPSLRSLVAVQLGRDSCRGFE